MTVIVAKNKADDTEALLRQSGETVFRLGEIRERHQGEPQTIVE